MVKFSVQRVGTDLRFREQLATIMYVRTETVLIYGLQMGMQLSILLIIFFEQHPPHPLALAYPTIDLPQ